MTGRPEGLARRVRTIQLGSLVVILAAWEALARSGLLYRDVVPSLLAVGRGLYEVLLDPALYAHLWVTVFEVVVGLAIAAALGIVCGIALGARRFLGAALEPFIDALATTPKIIFLPIVMLFAGIGIESKIALGALSGFFPIIISTAAGMLEIRPVYIRVARTFNVSAGQMIRKIYLPCLVVPIATGMRLGLGVVIIGVLLGEIKMAKAGIGFLANDYYIQFDIPRLYAVLIVVFALAVLANAAMNRVTAKVGRGR